MIGFGGERGHIHLRACCFALPSVASSSTSVLSSLNII